LNCGLKLELEELTQTSECPAGRCRHVCVSCRAHKTHIGTHVCEVMQGHAHNETELNANFKSPNVNCVVSRNNSAPRCEGVWGSGGIAPPFMTSAPDAVEGSAPRPEVLSGWDTRTRSDPFGLGTPGSYVTPQCYRDGARSVHAYRRLARIYRRVSYI
jgi:hypothetical protein